MQKIFPCLDIKKIFSPSWNVQQETIFSVGKSSAIINPWDCLEVGVKTLVDKLNLKILPIEVNIIKFFSALEINNQLFLYCFLILLLQKFYYFLSCLYQIKLF